MLVPARPRIVPLQHAGAETAATEAVRVAGATRIVRRDRDVPVDLEATSIVAERADPAVDALLAASSPGGDLDLNWV